MTTSIKPNALSIAFNRLENANKVSKKDLNKTSKLVNDIVSVKNKSKDINLLNINPKEFGPRIENLMNKLEKQNSGMYKEKSAKLNAIKHNLVDIPAKKQLDVNSIKITKLKTELKEFTDLHNKATIDAEKANQNLLKYENKFNELENKISTIGSDELKDLESKRDEKKQAVVNNLKTTYTYLKNQLTEHKSTLNEYKNSIKNNIIEKSKQYHIDNMEEMLELADKGAIKDKSKNTWGFPEAGSWKNYLTGDSFAKKHFGLVTEHGSNGKTWKTPTPLGKEYQNLISKYLNPQTHTADKIHKIQGTLTDIQYQIRVHEDRINRNPEPPILVQMENELDDLSMKVEQANIDKQKALSTLSTYENKLTDIHSELKKLDNKVTELKTVI